MEATINELKRIAALSTASVGETEKAFIKALAEEWGVDIGVKKNCKSCYIDAAIMIYKKIKDSEEPQQDNGAIWKLKKGIDVIWNGIRINAATITDEKAVKYIKCGFPIFYFEKNDN